MPWGSPRSWVHSFALPVHTKGNRFLFKGAAGICLHLSFAHPNDHSPVHYRVSITAHLPLGELGTDPAQLGLRRPGNGAMRAVT